MPKVRTKAKCAKVRESAKVRAKVRTPIPFPESTILCFPARATSQTCCITNYPARAPRSSPPWRSKPVPGFSGFYRDTADQHIVRFCFARHGDTLRLAASKHKGRESPPGLRAYPNFSPLAAIRSQPACATPCLCVPSHSGSSITVSI